MSRGPLSVGMALALVASWGTGQEAVEPLPEGYGERWIVPRPAWRFTPGSPLEVVSASGATLERGDFLIVPADGLKSLEVLLGAPPAGSRLGPAERAQVYLCEKPNRELMQTNARSPQITPNRQHPPLGRAMLAVRLPTQTEVLSGGVARLWADLGLRPGRGWFAVRAGEELELSVRGLSFSRPIESWERLERAMRNARDPEAPWPQVWRARETLPGREVESFLARQKVLIPWTPAHDNTLARRTRIAAFQIQSHVVRPRQPNHTRVEEWSPPDGDDVVSFKDTPPDGGVWGRTYALTEVPWEETVVGPATLRVQVRATWSHRNAPPNSVARFGLEVAGTTHRFERLVRPDLRATGELFDDEDVQEQLARRELHDLVISGWSEVRITVPPGEHAVRVIPETPNLWFAVEALHRTLDLHATAPFDELPTPEEFDADDPEQGAAPEPSENARHDALRALGHELRGNYTDALEAYAALGEQLDAYRTVVGSFADITSEIGVIDSGISEVTSEVSASDPQPAVIDSRVVVLESGVEVFVPAVRLPDPEPVGAMQPDGVAAVDSTQPAATNSWTIALTASGSITAIGSGGVAPLESKRISLAGIASLDSSTRVQLNAWVKARRASLAERLGDPELQRTTRAQLDALVEEGCDAPLDPWGQLALETALRLWLEHELVPPPEPWARQGLNAPHLHPHLYALVFRALAALPDSGAERLPIAPAQPRNTRDLRALVFQTQLSARRRASSRYARLPRTHHSTGSAQRFLLPVLAAIADTKPDPRAESAWQLAQTAIRATALLARATPLALEARSDEPISLLALNDGWRGGLSIEVGGAARGQLTHVSPWAPVELSLEDARGKRVGAGDPIRLEADPFNTEPWLLVRGRVRPRGTTDAYFCDPVTLDRLEPDGEGRERLEARLSEGDYLSALRISLGVRVSYPWPDLDLPFELEIEGQPRRELRLLYIRGPEPKPEILPGPVVRAEFVVPARARTVRVVGPYDYPSYASVEEQRFGQPPLQLPAGAGTLDVPPSGIQRVLRRAVDVEAHLGTLRALGARLGGSSRGQFDSDEALPVSDDDTSPQLLALGLLERSLILLELDQTQRARRDLLRALTISPASDRLLQVRIHTALAALAFELEDTRRLRSHTRSALRGGGMSVELCLLAAASTANRDKLLARAWLERAVELRGIRAADDLELLLRRRYGLPPLGSPQGIYYRRLFNLESWGRTRDLSQEELYAGLAREAQALREAAAELTEIGRRQRAAHLLRLAAGCMHARVDLGLGHWPPAHGALDPAARRWSLPSHAIDARPPEVWLEGSGDRWRATLLRSDDPPILFRVQGPTTLLLTARPAHLRSADGRLKRHVAPLRYALSGLPTGTRTRTVISSRPSLVVRPGEPVRAGPGADAPELACGSGDVWRIHVPAGRHRLAVEPLAGAGFFALEEEIGRTAGPSPGDLAPRRAPPRPPRLLLLRPRESPQVSLERRVAELTAAVDPDPGLVTQLADDLLFAGLTGTSGPEDEHVLRALAVYALLGDDPHPDSRHANAHFGLALGLTRRRSVDLAAQVRDYRRLRLVRGAHREPNLAAAVFDPPGTESLILEGRTTRWRFSSAEPSALALEVAANVESPLSLDRAQVNVWVDGQLTHAGPLELGRRVLLPLARSTQRATVRLLTDPPYADAGMRVHARLMRRAADDDAWEPYAHSAVERVYAADGREIALPLRGPTLLELEHWDEATLARREVNLWEPTAQDIPHKEFLPVVRRGITPHLKLPESGYVRLLRREVNPEPLAFTREALRGAKPPGPARVSRPPAPPGFGLPRPREPEFIRPGMWDHEFVFEPYLLGTLRERANERQADDEVRSDTLELGVRLHHYHPVRHHADAHQTFPIYTRFSMSGILVDGQDPVARAGLRVRAYLTQVPNLSLQLRSWVVAQQASGGSQKALQGEVRLRYSQPLVWRLQTIVDTEIGFWTSSVSRRRLFRLGDDLYSHVASGYRADHRAWIRLGARLRWVPYQNVYVEALTRYRTNESLRPQDAERLTVGVRARWHHEFVFAEASYLHLHRFADADRSSTDDEDQLLADVGVETWLSPSAWVGVHVGGRYAFQSRAIIATFSVEFRFSTPGTRHRAIDPLMTRGARYQDAVYPWPR